MSRRPERRRAVRAGALAEGAHFALVVVLTLALAALLCYVSTRRFARMDWRSTARQPLTRDTRALLARVGQDVEATIICRTLYFPADKQWMRAQEIARQVLGQFHAANPRIAVSELSWSAAEDQGRLQQIVRELGEKSLPVMCVVFVTAEGHAIISFDKLIYQAGGPFAPPDAFIGESAFARAVAGLTGLQALAPDPSSGARRMQFFNLPPGRVRAARYVFVAGLPACFIVLGAVVWLVRRG
jgi:hypothetical protein